MRPMTGSKHANRHVGAAAAPRREATAPAHSAPPGWTRERRDEFRASLLGSVANLAKKFGLSRGEAARQAVIILREPED